MLSEIKEAIDGCDDSDSDDSDDEPFDVMLPAQVALFALCHGQIKRERRAPDADQALSLLLHLKSQKHCSANIFGHRRSLSSSRATGRSKKGRRRRRTKRSSTSGAIHAVTRHCHSGDAKWLLLFEIMLREGAPTALLEHESHDNGHSGGSKTHSVLDQVIKTRNETLCDLIFEHAVDIDSSDKSAIFAKSRNGWTGDWDGYVCFLIVYMSLFHSKRDHAEFLCTHRNA